MSEEKKSELLQLFAEYDQANLKIQEAEKEVERMTKERSEVVRKMAVLMGPKKKIEYKGKILTLVQRGETFFFRGANEQVEILKVD